MPKKRVSSPVPRSMEVQRFDETNVARLGLISIQERIPGNMTVWTSEFTVDGRPAKLTCEALPQYGGVPHGLDNDVSLALFALYTEQGTPEDGTFTTTAYQILKTIGLDTSGYYYKALRTSLDRLTTTTYTASEAWRTPEGKWTTVKFRYIDRLEYTSDDARLGLSGGSVIKVTLAREIVRSFRAQFVKPIDLTFLASLQRPLARALYRLLDAQRFDLERGPLPAIEVGLVDWGKACKLFDLKPAKIKRTLDGAHEELIERGYLRAVEYSGRGVKQALRYLYAEAPADPAVDEAALAQLTGQGVARAVAAQLIHQYGEGHVAERLARFTALLQGGYTPRRRAGLLVDVIRDDQGKYSDPVEFASAERAARTEARRAEQQRTLDRQLADDDAQRAAAWESLPLELRAEQAFKSITPFFGRRLSTATLGALRDRMLSGQLDPQDLTARTIKAAMDMQLEHLAEELTALAQGGRLT